MLRYKVGGRGGRGAYCLWRKLDSGQSTISEKQRARETVQRKLSRLTLPHAAGEELFCDCSMTTTTTEEAIEEDEEAEDEEAAGAE